MAGIREAEARMLQDYFTIKLSTLMWGFIGGATAAMFGPSTWKHRVATTFVGTVVASAFGPLWVNIAHSRLLQHFNVSVEDVMPPVIFLCGLIGMWSCAIVIELLKTVQRRGPEIIGQAIKKRLGL